MIETKVVKIATPKDCNLILLQSHFIKTVEDIHETLVNSVPGIKFGLAFIESSGSCLVRRSGTDKDLIEAAANEALKLGTGHAAIIFLKETYPINVLNALRNVPEVCHIIAATANPVEVITVETSTGRGILGVIDGSHTKGIETEKDVKERKELLRKLGYKF